MTTSLATRLQPTIWPDATPVAQIGEFIQKPFCPIARVVDKEVLADGRTCLIVAFPGCRDHKAEEWVLPAIEIVAPATDIISVEGGIAEATAIASNPDRYADGIRRDSAIGKLRAEEEATLAAMWKQDDQAWYKVGENKYNRAEIQRDQKSLTSKKVQIIHWWPNHLESVGPMWVNISDLLTNEQNSKQKQSETKKHVATPAAVAPTQTDNAPPNRGNSGREQVQPIIKTVAQTEQETSERPPTPEEQRTDDIAKKFAEDWENWNVFDTGYFLKFKRPYALTKKQVDWLRSVYVKQFKWGESRDKAYERRSMDNMGSTYQREFMWQVSIHANGSGTFEVLIRK
jgi:hypothetical protein